MKPYITIPVALGVTMLAYYGIQYFLGYKANPFEILIVYFLCVSNIRTGFMKDKLDGKC